MFTSVIKQKSKIYMQIQVVGGLEMINFMLVLQIYIDLAFSDGIEIIESNNCEWWSCNNIDLAVTAVVMK